MKKIGTILFLIISIVVIVYFGFNYKTGISAASLYKVYLDDEVIGVIDSKEELEDYIDSKSNEYKKKYNVDKVYSPNGLKLQKVTTYDVETNSIEDIYKIISQKASFTIEGYEFKIKSDDKEIVIYTLKEETFKTAIYNTIKAFVGEEDYTLYISDEQNKIITTGSLIEDVYVEEDITFKKTKIDVDENIYTEPSDLAKFLVYGTIENQKTYIVKVGDTIEDVAFNNEISVEEFLISNPTFTSSKNLLFPGQEVVIGITNPQISVVDERYVVEDTEIKYQLEYQYDENKSTAYEESIQKGENGLERVSKRVKNVNGIISYVEPISKEELKPAINQIILKGKKVMNGVGSLKNWLWPTNSGYTITSNWTYRINPITGVRELHKALDIAGTGYGSPIYAVTNGVVSESSYRREDGNYVCINHNVQNYYTCYAHMSKRNVVVNQVVERGDIIGYIGNTGYATGPHLHFEVWIGKPWYGGYRIKPTLMYQ